MIEEHIRRVPHFPKEGVLFYDMTPLLAQPEAFRHAIDRLVERYRSEEVEGIVCLDARGFLLGAPLAYAMGLPCIPVRKRGKLPGETLSASYSKEYGEDHLEMQKDSLRAGTRVVLVDDLLATGGTLEAACRLVERAGGSVVEIACLIELPDLEGRSRLSYPVHALFSPNEELP